MKRPGRLHYKASRPLFVSALVALALAVVNYYLFFDVLAPGLGNSGSVKASLGPAFVFPVLLLAVIQVSYAAGVLHLVTRSFYPDRHDFLKALFVGSVLVLMYSIYYTLVPNWGPYTFLTGPLRDVPAIQYVVLGVWTAVVIAATALLIRRVYGFKKGDIRWRVLLLLTGGIFLIVLAFAEG
ncbi:MAG TPA: hypothetical protein VLY21_06565 [Nitrososphaerales archaeon]|nr:hypothetical protein [Nitrososphaerales archaeon]